MEERTKLLLNQDIRKKITHKKAKTERANKTILWRILFSIILCALLILTIFLGKRPYRGELQEGDISLRSVFAPVDFSYIGGEDKELTKSLRQKAMNRVRPVYDLDANVAKDIIRRLDKFFSQILVLQEQKDSLQFEEMLSKTNFAVKVSDTNLKTLIQDAAVEKVSAKVNKIVETIEGMGILTVQDRNKLSELKTEEITIRRLEQNKEEQKQVSELLNVENAGRKIEELVLSLFPTDRRMRIAIIDLVSKFISPSLFFNEEETRLRRLKAAEAIPLQYKQIEVKKNELIIAKGHRVDKKHLTQLKVLSKLQTKKNAFSSYLGVAILVIIIIGLTAVYLSLSEPKVFFNNRDTTILGLLIILGAILAKSITLSPLPSYFIPTAMISMLIAILISYRIALMVTVVLSLLVGIIAGDKLNVTFVSLVGGIVGSYSVLGIRRRSQLLYAGFLVGLANFTCISGIGLFHSLEYTVFLKEGFWGISNGFISVIIVAGLLPVFEFLFKKTTNISLLELSDLNHPLLRELVVTAPGTYHHSLVVGNLAEAACEAIGANPLLARVGSYYHDIGKLGKAEYFSENQQKDISRHEKLSPTMSSLIITNHVKDGVELAHKYKLNEAIIDFIREHHGTGLIYYFYQRALEKVESQESLKEEEFRYPGPRPQRKETAVVLLADSVEAASRVLNEPTPSRIKGLVRKIINNKFIDNQLDECDLTLKDLNKIAQVFTHILTGIFHTRVEYPVKK